MTAGQFESFVRAEITKHPHLLLKNITIWSSGGGSIETKSRFTRKQFEKYIEGLAIQATRDGGTNEK